MSPNWVLVDHCLNGVQQGLRQLCIIKLGPCECLRCSRRSWG